MLLEGVARAVEGGEPVLLVGETGVGKTASVQFLAEQTGRSVKIVQSNPNPIQDLKKQISDPDPDQALIRIWMIKTSHFPCFITTKIRFFVFNSRETPFFPKKERKHVFLLLTVTTGTRTGISFQLIIMQITSIEIKSLFSDGTYRIFRFQWFLLDLNPYTVI